MRRAGNSPALLVSRFGTRGYRRLSDQAPKPCVVTYMTRFFRSIGQPIDKVLAELAKTTRPLFARAEQ